MASRGQRRHLVSLRNPGANTPDDEGGFTNTPTVFATRMAEIKPATARDLERVAAGTVVSSASHVVVFDYHVSVTTKTEIIFGTRVFTVSGVSSPEERNIDSVCVCEEVVA